VSSSSTDVGAVAWRHRHCLAAPLAQPGGVMRHHTDKANLNLTVPSRWVQDVHLSITVISTRIVRGRVWCQCLLSPCYQNNICPNKV
jgi:hypothetical protein